MLSVSANPATLRVRKGADRANMKAAANPAFLLNSWADRRYIQRTANKPKIAGVTLCQDNKEGKKALAKLQ